MRDLHHYAARLAMCAVVVMAGDALAGNFEIEPTRLDLVRRGGTAELTISNRSTTEVRFEAKTYVWRQDEQGVMQLAPTTDVVVYPTLFALAPGATRAIRIATTATPGGSEQSYRIFVEELPPRKVAVADGTPATIAVLARIGVPIFLAPARPLVSGAIVGSVSASAVHLAIENHGSVHVKVATVRVIGHDRAGHVVLDVTQASWYLLAGGTRRHELALDATTCRSIDGLSVEAATDRGTWQASIAMPSDGCQIRP